MPKLNGVEVARYLRATGRLHDNRLHILALSAYNTDSYVQGLLDAGATGYVLKDEALETIVAAVQSAAQGQPWFSPSVLTRRNGRSVGVRTCYSYGG